MAVSDAPSSRFSQKRGFPGFNALAPCIGAEAAAEGVAGLGAGSCAGAELVNRSKGARTRTVDRGIRREAKLKMGLLGVGVSRSVP